MRNLEVKDNAGSSIFAHLRSSEDWLSDAMRSEEYRISSFSLYPTPGIGGEFQSSQVSETRHKSEWCSNTAKDLHLTNCRAPGQLNPSGCLTHFQSAARERDEITKVRTGHDPHLDAADRA